MQVAIGTGEMVDFQTLDLFLDRSGRGQKGRHGDDGAQMRGNTAGKLQGREKAGVETEPDRPIDQRDRRVDGGRHAQQSKNYEQARGYRALRVRLLVASGLLAGGGPHAHPSPNYLVTALEGQGQGRNLQEGRSHDTARTFNRFVSGRQAGPRQAIDVT